ncbi:MAG: hypothetical protein JXD22_06190 [Sedimentisphaerales bacterium]|nr:hypothetical protein [Sedimentisphaerales bacterium]
MNRTKLLVFLLIFPLFIISMAGCATDSAHLQDFSRSSLAQVPYDTAFDACEKVMRGEFGRVSADRELGTIESKTTSWLQATTPTDINKSDTRRRALLNLQHRGGKLWVYTQVNIERSDTQTYQMFQNQRSGRDYGLPSPMEAEAAAPAKRRVWTKIERKRSLEKQLISRIRQELGLEVQNPRPVTSAPDTDSE